VSITDLSVDLVGDRDLDSFEGVQNIELESVNKIAMHVVSILGLPLSD
jgi:hypothetical protein